MQAEIVTIGTELLLGDIVDTNSTWIARQLTTIGLNLFYTTTVGDNLQRLGAVLRAALQRSDVVITTGGLGPTVDDMTREAVALATDRALVLDEDLVREIASYFARRGREMTENNRKQACLPEGAWVIHNPVGTAPSFGVEQDGHIIICLPGVPHEMRYLMEREVLPYLGQRFGLQGVIISRVLRTCGIGESALGDRIGDLMEGANPTVGTAAHPGQTDVRITAKADSATAAGALIAPVERELLARIGDYVYGFDADTLSEVVVRLLAERGLRLAVAETATDGELAGRLNQATEAERAFAGGLVAPTVDQLAAMVGLDSPLGPEGGELTPSQALADALAEAARGALGADLGLAAVGLSERQADDASPIFFSLAYDEGVRQAVPRSGRKGVSGRGWALHLGLDLLRRHLLGLSL